MRGRLPLPPIPGQPVGGGVPDAPRRLAPPPFPGLLPAETCAAANTPRRGQDPSLRTEPLTPAYANPRAGHARPLPRGGPGTGVRVNPTAFPYPPIRRAGCPHPAATFRQRPSPGQPPAEGSRPLPTGRTIDGCPRNPPGRACPAPTARRPGNDCPRKPHSVSISPSVGRGAPTPPRPSATAHSRATRRGRRPRRPAEACADALPRVTTRGDSRCRQPPRRGQDPSLQAEPLTSAHVTPRAGHARPLPRNNPTNLYTT